MRALVHQCLPHLHQAANLIEGATRHGVSSSGAKEVNAQTLKDLK